MRGHLWTTADAKRIGSAGGRASARKRRKAAALRIAAQLAAIIPRDAHERIEAALEDRDYALIMALLVRAWRHGYRTKGSADRMRKSALKRAA